MTSGHNSGHRKRIIPHDFGTVDQKVAETESFLQLMAAAGSNQESFRHAFSAFVSAARTITLALQHFTHLPGFEDWYRPHRQRLKTDTLARLFLEVRNQHVHGGPHPVTRVVFSPAGARYYFDRALEQGDDVVSMCRKYMVLLLQIVYDCYVKLGVHIDPQQYFTKEHFESRGGTIDDAEIEVYGWVCTHLIEEGLNEEGRWQELRSQLDECQINNLFYAYLGRPTPQPHLSEEALEIEYTPEERGWWCIPAGYKSVEAYWDNYPELLQLELPLRHH
jgi:hypothetical protein